MTTKFFHRFSTERAHFDKRYVLRLTTRGGCEFEDLDVRLVCDQG